MLASIAIALGVLLAQADAREQLPPAGYHPGLIQNGTVREEVSEVAEQAGTPAEHIFHHVQDEPNWIPIPLNVNVGGHELNLNIGKHTVSMWIASLLLVLTFAFAVRKKALVPQGLYSALESFVIFIRDDIAVQNIGHGGEKYTPYLCTAFFFILFINLFGLIPVHGVGTATGNLSVTVVLALFTFVVTQIAGMRSQGAVGYRMHLVPAGVPKWLYPIMIPVELMGLFTKPFALTVRLFANMLAGHIVIYFLLGLTVMLAGGVAMHALGISVIAVPFALAIYLLEIFVALVQAYVFTMLSAVFIGLASHSH